MQHIARVPWFLKAFLSTAAFLLFFIGGNARCTTTIMTLDVGTGSDVGAFSSQAIVNGNPAIAYYDVSGGDLKYARNSAADGSGVWTVVTVASQFDVGTGCVLMVINGAPAIAYRDKSHAARSVCFIRALDANGTTWGTPVSFQSSVAGNPSMAVVNGRPALAWTSSAGVSYVRANDADGSSWGTPSTATTLGGGSSGGCQMVVVNGHPAIALHHLSGGDLCYVRANDPDGTTWAPAVTVDSQGDSGTRCTMAVVNGRPAIAYYSGGGGLRNLKYVRAADANGTAWGASQTVYSSSVQIQQACLAVVNGNPAISFGANLPDEDLVYLRAADANGDGWGSPITLDSPGQVGAYSSLLEAGGAPTISYYDQSNGDLKYVRAVDASGTSWLAGSTVDDGAGGTGNTGRYTSQAIVAGHPAIAYHDSTDGNLRYVRALDPAGTLWPAPTTVASDGTAGLHASLAVVNGNPAISYLDGDSLDLMYVRANDSTGSSWGTPVAVETEGWTGYYSCLRVANGRPAIAHYDVTTGSLKYVRAADADGTTWGTPVVVHAGAGSPNSTYSGSKVSMEIVNGNPAIVYTAAFTVRYVRANDSSGATWDASTLLIAGSGSYPSLAVIDGRPVVCVGSATTLVYIRAADANGAAWNEAVRVMSNTVPRGISITTINGTPAVAFATQGAQLMYARARDAFGSSWSSGVALDTVGPTGDHPSMLDLGGKAVISYYDSGNGDLKWLVYSAPEIVVEQPEGTQLVYAQGTVDFGSVTIPGGSAPITFTVRNAGAEELTLGNITKSGHGADFTVDTTFMATSLAPGSSTTFSVTFTPLAAGARTATIGLAHNGPDGNPFYTRLTGTGVDETPPDTTMVTGPAMFVSSTTATFTFSGTDNVGVTGYEGSLDGAPFAAVASPLQLSNLTEGSHTFEVRAKDAAGNVDPSPASRSWFVDVTPPTLSLPGIGMVVVEATSAEGATVNYSASASDPGGSGIAISSFLPASGSVFPIGVTSVNASAMDNAGNLAAGIFAVKVQDTTAPVVTPPADVVAEATMADGATVSYGSASATDAVGVTNITYSRSSGSIFPLGETTVTITATDEAGNAGTATFKVTVRDTTAPVVTPPADVVVEASGPDGAFVTYGSPLATDEVGVTNIVYAPPTASFFSLGETMVTITATDAAGNVGTATFRVTVQDTTAPTIEAPEGGFSPLVFFVEQGGTVALPDYAAAAVINDAVGVIETTQSPEAGSLVGEGVTTVTLTARDEAGNTAEFEFGVRVLVDGTAVLAIKGGLVPGAGTDARIPANSVWSTFGPPSIMAQGTRAGWQATVLTPAVPRSAESPRGVPASRFKGIFAGPLGAPVLKVRTGSTVTDADGDEVGGVTFKSFREPVFAGDGFAVLATVRGTGVRAANDTGIWVEEDGKLLEIAREGSAAPGAMEGARFKAFTSLAMPAPGFVGFVATLASPASKDMGLWVWTPAGGLRKALREGDPVDTGSGEVPLKSFKALTSVPGSFGHGRYDAAAEKIDALLTLSDGRTALARVAADGGVEVTALARQLDDAGRTLASLGLPSSSGGVPSHVVALANLAVDPVAGIKKANDAGVYDGSQNGFRASEGTEAEDAAPARFRSFLNPVAGIGHDGNAVKAFAANLAGAPAAMAAGLWVHGTDLALLARKGAEPVGVPGTKWKSFTSLSVMEGRGPIFTGKLANGTTRVSAKNNAGLWAVDSTGALRLVLRTSDPVAGGTLKSFNVLGAVAGSPGQRRAWTVGDPSARVIFLGYLTDGSGAIMTTAVP